MHHELDVLADPAAVARRAAAYVAEHARTAVDAHGTFSFAVSGGHTPWAMFAELAFEDVPWETVVLLGLGPDGHTASLVPGDPVLEVGDRLVGLTDPYRGRRRITFTYPALARARQLLWLITGTDKRDPLAKLLAGDPSIPAGRVEAMSSVVLADRSAASDGVRRAQ